MAYLFLGKVARIFVVAGLILLHAESNAQDTRQQKPPDSVALDKALASREY